MVEEKQEINLIEERDRNGYQQIRPKKMRILSHCQENQGERERYGYADFSRNSINGSGDF